MGGKRRKKSRFGIQVEGGREGRTGPIGGGRAGEGEDAEESGERYGSGGSVEPSDVMGDSRLDL